MVATILAWRPVTTGGDSRGQHGSHQVFTTMPLPAMPAPGRFGTGMSRKSSLSRPGGRLRDPVPYRPPPWEEG